MTKEKKFPYHIQIKFGNRSTEELIDLFATGQLCSSEYGVAILHKLVGCSRVVFCETGIVEC